MATPQEPTTTTTTPTPTPTPTTPSHLLTHLSTKTTTLEDLHQTLLSSLQRAGWAERVRALAIELLRAGRAGTFEELLEEVVGSVVVADKGKAKANGGSKNANGAVNGGANGVEDEDRDAEGEVEEEGEDGPQGYVNGGIEDIDVRIPEAVVGEGMRFLQEALDGVLDADGEGEEGEEGDEAGEKKPPVEKAGNANGKRKREDGGGEEGSVTKKTKGAK